ncbi:MAG: DUF3015 domain-containing protein [Bdellovibrionales bacterium]|nr:DUF3015 domain-containing protein [Bdellovibrionales bacterium]
MTKRFLVLTGLLLAPTVALASPNVGGCGLGSKLMEGNEGIAPQVLAVTTNGTSGNQTFGITSGTSGCTQDGVVKSNWKTAMYIDSNMNKLARDMSVGEGESLDSLASLLNMNQGDKEVFTKTVQENFGRIFPAADVDSAQVRSGLRAVLVENSQLAAYAEQI